MNKISSPSNDEYRRRICRAIDYINSHLHEHPSVAEIARAAPFSSYHFQRLFRAFLGETVNEFTRRVLLETAARRLIFRPSEDVTSLALDLGFSSSQNFAKAFKQHFCVSPTQYRTNQLSFTDLGLGLHDVASHEDLLADDAEIGKFVVVRELDSLRVVYLRHFGSYRDPGLQQVFDDLQRWTEAHHQHDDGNYLGIPWDDMGVTSDQHCRFDACLIVSADTYLSSAVNVQTIPAGRYATYRCEIVANDFEFPWTRLMRAWLPGSSFQPADGPRFEIYHNDGSKDPAGRWDIEVCLPVVPL